MSHRDDATTQSTQPTERDALNDTARIILDKAIVIHSRLGPGLLESVYRTCLTHELRKDGQKVVTEQLVIGLLINFKVPQLMQGVKRIVNNF